MYKWFVERKAQTDCNETRFFETQGQRDCTKLRRQISTAQVILLEYQITRRMQLN